MSDQTPVTLADELAGAVRIRAPRARKRAVVNGMDVVAIKAMQARLEKLKQSNRRKNARAWKKIKSDPQKLAAHQARVAKWETANPEARLAARKRWLERNAEWNRKYQREWKRKKAAEVKGDVS